MIDCTHFETHAAPTMLPPAAGAQRPARVLPRPAGGVAVHDGAAPGLAGGVSPPADGPHERGVQSRVKKRLIENMPCQKVSY